MSTKRDVPKIWASTCGLLDAPDPTKLAEFAAIAEHLSEVDLPQVRDGDFQAIRLFTDAWSAASVTMLETFQLECPEPRMKVPTFLVREQLELAAELAPFSSFLVSDRRQRDALALYLVDTFRHLCFDANALTVPVNAALWDDDAMPASRWHNYSRIFRTVLSEQHAMIDQLGDAFDLTNREIADMFGVSPQAIGNWYSGIPANRQAKAVTVMQIADILRTRIKPERLPGIARKPAAAYGGLNMLQMIAADRHQELLDLVRASFDFAATA